MEKSKGLYQNVDETKQGMSNMCFYCNQHLNEELNLTVQVCSFFFYIFSLFEIANSRLYTRSVSIQLS